MAVFNDRATLSVARRPGLFRWLAAMALCALAACGGGVRKPPTGTPEPDKFLFDRGSEELTKHHWLTSREYFRQLVDTYPQSRTGPMRSSASATPTSANTHPSRSSLQATSSASS